MDRTLSGRGVNLRFRLSARTAGRGLGLIGKARGVRKIWRERMRQRRALAMLSAHDLADLGIPLGLAAYEVGRWPWQPISADWRALADARRAAAPIERSSPRPPRSERPRARRV